MLAANVNSQQCVTEFGYRADQTLTPAKLVDERLKIGRFGARAYGETNVFPL